MVIEGVAILAVRAALKAGRDSIAPAHIFSSRDRLQMGRPNAASDAALVIDSQPFRNWADQEFVGIAMGTSLFALHLQDTITTLIEFSSP